MTAAQIQTRSSPAASDLGHIVLRNISWETYESLLRDLEEEHYRLTYDEGTLEITPPSRLHERAGQLLGRLIHTYTEVRDIPIASFGGATWRRRDVARGLEADECYYVASEPRVRGHDDVDIQVDPQPDLAIEVDVTRSTLDKQRIYAALGVPELWRWEDESLLVLVLGADGQYTAAKASPSFPNLPLADIARFMSMRQDTSETAWIKLFREWLNSTA
jgi:Uma2 family endonuclease